MKITAVIPAYNEERYIGACLAALQAQTRQPDEIIVVDNNSTDQTAAIAQKYNARVVHEPKQGMAFARSRGFDEASGEIIARCDSDCVPPKNWIAEIETAFSDQSVDAVTGPLIYKMGINTSIPARLFSWLIWILLGGKVTLFGPNMALRKEIWEKVRTVICTNDKEVHEDIDLSVHILRAGGHISFDNKCYMYTSNRRMVKNPFSFLCDYPIITFKTIFFPHPNQTASP